VFLAKPLVVSSRISKPKTLLDYENQMQNLNDYSEILNLYREMKHHVHPSAFVYCCMFRALKDESRLKLLFQHCVSTGVYSNKSIQAFLRSLLHTKYTDYDEILQKIQSLDIQLNLDTWKLLLVPYMRTGNKHMIEKVHRRMTLQEGWDINCYIYLIHAHSKVGNGRAVVRLFEEMTQRQFNGDLLLTGMCVTFADTFKAMHAYPAKHKQLMSMSSIVLQNWKSIHSMVSAWWDEHGWIEGVQNQEPVRLKTLYKAGVGSILDAIAINGSTKYFQSWVRFVLQLDSIKNQSDLYVFAEVIRHGSTLLPASTFLSCFDRYKAQRSNYITMQNLKSNIPLSLSEMTKALVQGSEEVIKIRDWSLPEVPRREIAHAMYLLGKERRVTEIKRIWDEDVAKLLPFLWSRVLHSIRNDILRTKDRLQSKLNATKSQKGCNRGQMKEEITYLNKQLKKGVLIQLGEQGPLGVVYSRLIEGWRAGEKKEDEHVLELEKLLQTLKAKEKSILEMNLNTKGDRLLYERSET
jgi:hypothetical protein